jgi:hypothetical protein
MMQSEQINELAAALAKAQGAIKGATKDTANPFFKSKYADLASVWDACRAELTANGLSIIQTTDDSQGVTVVTTLAHSSGQWIRGRLTMRPVKDDPQGIGSAITYARRYALAAMVGVAPEDDDGNAASGRNNNNANVPDVQPMPKKDPIAPWRGPLTKTDLVKQLRKLTSDIVACDDADQLNACVASYQAVIDQCAVDMPEWHHGEAHDGFIPLQDRILQRTAELNPRAD